MLKQLTETKWRVLAKGGELKGYIDLVSDQHGSRYLARVMQSVVGLRMLEIGRFWSLSDATNAIKYA